LPGNFCMPEEWQTYIEELVSKLSKELDELRNIKG
jgi:hypothetical protein